MEIYIPEDIITEILTRIPAHQVIELRRVSKHWKVLIRSKYFQNSHLIRLKERGSSSSSSVIIFQRSGDGVGQLSVIDKWKHPPGSEREIFLRGNPNLIREFRNPRFDYSHDGFVVMHATEGKLGGSIFVNMIYNPVTRENVTVKSADKFSILALFFNRWLKQYCVLVKIKRELIEYEILNLSSLPSLCRRITWMYRIFDASRYSSPVIINNEYIYWKVKMFFMCRFMIICFHIGTEEFSFLGHPKPYLVNDCMVNMHKNMHIVNIGDNLAYIHQEFPVVNDLVLNIWTIDHIKNRRSQEWSKVYTVTIDVHKFNVDRRILNPYSGLCKVMAVENGELLLKNCFGGVFAYNVASGTVREIAVDSPSSRFSMYIPSFATLNNCASRSSVILI